jgi:hypothetical protein
LRTLRALRRDSRPGTSAVSLFLDRRLARRRRFTELTTPHFSANATSHSALPRSDGDQSALVLAQAVPRFAVRERKDERADWRVRVLLENGVGTCPDHVGVALALELLDQLREQSL